MSLVGWLVVLALPVYAAVQLWLVRRLGRRFEREDEGRTAPNPAFAGAPPGAVPSDGGSDDGVRCPACGAENEPSYRFCRRCVSTLPAVTAQS